MLTRYSNCLKNISETRAQEILNIKCPFTICWIGSLEVNLSREINGYVRGIKIAVPIRLKRAFAMATFFASIVADVLAIIAVKGEPMLAP